MEARNAEKSPDGNPCAERPMMSVAVIVPVTVPDDAGHAGFDPPPHRKAITPPLVALSPKWMWAIDTPVRPENVRV